MSTLPVVKGAITYLPFVSNFTQRKTGGTNSARYCYSVWLRHIVMAEKNGLNPYPVVIAELGPGDSLGIGLAGLISGSDKYYAFDVIENSNAQRNKKIFDELVLLFRNRTPIPDVSEFPSAKPLLENYEFPYNIFSDEKLNKSLSESRLNEIRYSIENTNKENSSIQYKVPWYEKSILSQDSVDMIYSQAVLEHVIDLFNTYEAMRDWLKPDGFISHQIDFKSHGTSKYWNGHWQYSDFIWKIIKGRRSYLINRAPHSEHISILDKLNFKIICDIKIKAESKLKKNQLAEKFMSMSDDDFLSSGTFIQAVK